MGTVIYRSKMPLGLKRNFLVMPSAQWPALRCKHIPDRYEHLVRYVGWYSNRARGERAKEASPHAPHLTWRARGLHNLPQCPLRSAPAARIGR